MRIKSLFAVIVLMFSLGIWNEAAQGQNKGKGGGSSTTTPICSLSTTNPETNRRPPPC